MTTAPERMGHALEDYGSSGQHCSRLGRIIAHDVSGQNTRMMIGCRYPSMTAIAADDRMALNYEDKRETFEQIVHSDAAILTATDDPIYAQEITHPITTDVHTPKYGAWKRFSAM